MGKIILKIIGLTLVSVGVILIYDARKITKKPSASETKMKLH